jgi:hypothetical protein
MNRLNNFFIRITLIGISIILILFIIDYKKTIEVFTFLFTKPMIYLILFPAELFLTICFFAEFIRVAYVGTKTIYRVTLRLIKKIR